ncbi:MAG: outer membrane lipoprotein-sorting protein [Pseudomonadota bacterium]|nr:outer membrane lipoprotein-sorting protein [Pseudomonadota bacterium]
MRSEPPADASRASPTAPQLSAEEILRRNAAARGGLEAWRKIKTMVQIGRIERAGEVPGAAAHARLTRDASQIVGFRLELARPNKMRYELTYQGTTAIQAFDGKEGFTVQPGRSGAVARPFSESQTRAAADQLDLEGPLLNAAAKGTVVRLEAVDTVRDRPTYRLSLSMKSGVTRHVWVDAETFLDVKIDGTRQIGDRTWPVETSFEDFRKVGSIQVPYQIETAVGGVHTMESVKLSKVALNVPLEDSLFTLPRAPAAAPAPSSTEPRP